MPWATEAEDAALGHAPPFRRTPHCQVVRVGNHTRARHSELSAGLDPRWLGFRISAALALTHLYVPTPTLPLVRSLPERPSPLYACLEDSQRLLASSLPMGCADA